MLIRKLIHTIAAIALTATYASAQKESSPYLDVQIISVGEIPLRKFGAKAPSSEPTINAAQKAAPKDPSKKVAPQQESGVEVLSIPTDERPIKQLYVKNKGSYYAINCHQNRITQPYRVYYTDPKIVFYRKTSSSSDSNSFKEFFSYKVTPKQENILITLSKPADEKKWTTPTIKIHNLPSSKLPSPTTIVNATPKTQLGIKFDKKSTILKPHSTTSIANTGKPLTLQLAISYDKKRWSATQQIKVPTTNNLVIAYSVPQASAPKKGFKLIRGSYKHGSFRKLRKIKSNS